MSLLVAVTQGQVVAWICFVVGIAVLAGGMAVGLWTSFKQAPQTAQTAKDKLTEARARIDEAKGHLEESASAAADSNLESMTASAEEATTAVTAAGMSADAAGSALDQVQGIVAALPENLRFAGVLILVGTVLMGVATIQFGGVSLF